jgi:hypothetical protein
MDQLRQNGTLTNWPSTFKTRQDTLDIDFQNMSGARQRLLCSDDEESVISLRHHFIEQHFVN